MNKRFQFYDTVIISNSHLLEFTDGENFRLMRWSETVRTYLTVAFSDKDQLFTILGVHLPASHRSTDHVVNMILKLEDIKCDMMIEKNGRAVKVWMEISL